MFKFKATYNKLDESPVELMIYQDIGDDPFTGDEGFTAKDFIDSLKDIPNTRALDIRINSAGGSVWEGLAIKTHLDEWKGRKTASIDGMAASVASWLPMAVDEVRAPRHAQMFIHDAWGMCMGNAEDMRTQAEELEKTSNQIAAMYAVKTGKPVVEWRNMMKDSSLFTAEEANKLGLIDRLTDEAPVSNFSAIQIRNMKAKLATLNQMKMPVQQSEPKQTNNQKTNMNRKQKIALLNKWGISVSQNATDAFIETMLNTLKAMPEHNAKVDKDGEHTAECDCADCGAKNAPEPKEEVPDADADDGAPAKSEELFKAATANKKATEAMNRFLATQRRNAIQSSLDKFVTEGRLPANSLKETLDLAIAAEDTSEGINPIVNMLDKTLIAQPIGVAPLNIQLGDSDSIEDLNKNVTNSDNRQKN